MLSHATTCMVLIWFMAQRKYDSHCRTQTGIGTFFFPCSLLQDNSGDTGISMETPTCNRKRTSPSERGRWMVETEVKEVDQAGIYSMENPECTSNRTCLLLIQHWDQLLGILRAVLALGISQATSSSHVANAVFAPTIRTQDFKQQNLEGMATIFGEKIGSFCVS